MVRGDPSTVGVDDLVLGSAVWDSQYDMRIEVGRAPMLERSPELLTSPIRSVVGHVSVGALMAYLRESRYSCMVASVGG